MARTEEPVQRVTVRISKSSLHEAEKGSDTAKLLRERYETRVSAIKRFTDRLQKNRGGIEPDWIAALRELGIAQDEIDQLIARARNN